MTREKIRGSGAAEEKADLCVKLTRVNTRFDRFVRWFKRLIGFKVEGYKYSFKVLKNRDGLFPERSITVDLFHSSQKRYVGNEKVICYKIIGD